MEKSTNKLNFDAFTNDVLPNNSKEQRKIVQIVIDNDSAIWALCNDGKIFYTDEYNEWLKAPLPPIPQD